VDVRVRPPAHADLIVSSRPPIRRWQELTSVGMPLVAAAMFGGGAALGYAESGTLRYVVGLIVVVPLFVALAARSALLAGPDAGQLRRLVEQFGTPFFVTGRNNDVPPETLIAATRRMAAAAGVTGTA
jgi:hypothetical protein